MKTLVFQLLESKSLSKVLVSTANLLPYTAARCQDHWDDVEGVKGLELRDHRASDFLVKRWRKLDPSLKAHKAHPVSNFDGGK